LEDEGNLVYAIDFGLAKQYIDSKSMKHVAYREGKSIIGTANFVSINTHAGIEQSRRDDLESIGYLLLYFAKGKLPWQKFKVSKEDKQCTDIMKMKQSISLKDLCKGLPTEISTYIMYCRELKFEDRPNYEYLRRLFRIAMSAKKYECDNRFDWLPETNNLIETNSKDFARTIHSKINR
jgi:serine/threonine protein kinase